MHICISRYIFICIYTYTHAYIYICTYTYLNIHTGKEAVESAPRIYALAVYEYMYLSRYIYIYKDKYTYIHTYIHT
jgi:hypothetical protein